MHVERFMKFRKTRPMSFRKKMMGCVVAKVVPHPVIAMIGVIVGKTIWGFITTHMIFIVSH
jgi:hypothetical protein